MSKYMYVYIFMTMLLTSKLSNLVRILKLTVEQKCDIATRELDELREELQRKKSDMERSYDNHKVRTEVHLYMFVQQSESIYVMVRIPAI